MYLLKIVSTIYCDDLGDAGNGDIDDILQSLRVMHLTHMHRLNTSPIIHINISIIPYPHNIISLTLQYTMNS
uniref:Uncharacterized protein n=1 Tax=viral metagenome TaxID=1070528 RepID=A0A6C0BM22_9ZZZZ